MRLAGIFVAAGLVLASCSAAEEDEPEQAEGEEFAEGTYDVDPETGEISAVVTNESGTTTMRAGESVTPRLPEGFSIYPGAEIRNTVQIGRGEGTGVLISMASEDMPQDLVAFYRREAEAAGVEIELDFKTQAMTMIGGQASDGTSFTFQASRVDEETTGQLTVGRGLN